MAKELNKHTPDSEELFKRLESNDPNGLDDFEKEALEGFDSLEDIGLAKKLNAELNQKINERFFEKEEKKGGSSSWRYLSIAAGLMLIVGLTIFFMNLMNSKKELAAGDNVTSDKVVNEVSKPDDLAPVQESKPEEKNIADDAKPSEVISDVKANESSGASQPAREKAGKKTSEDETALRSRMVLKEPKKQDDLTFQNSAPKTADAEGDDRKQVDQNAGPPAGYTAIPVATENQKTGKGKEEEHAEKSVVYKENDNRNNNAPENSVAANGTKDLAKKSESQAKEKTKTNGEYFANEQKPAAAMDEVTSTSANSTKAPHKRDEHNAEFENASFAKPQDYIKNEIEKSEMLKENVKSFKAELNIDENGKVKEVKFLTKFNNCKGCETELRRILLNMSGWKTSKKVKETISYFSN